ncbi:MAG: QueT transporter family protein [Candidatus Zixiibacteriota bacterium]|nr:MAG: QueT transporter family protein [candidate division Zixibacteria bacterium]
MNSRRIRFISTSGLIAAVYTLLALVFMPISFGVYQVRVAEALTVLPFLTGAAVPGLYVGCVLANVIGGMGWLDIVIGPLLTLAAAIATRTIRIQFGDTRKGMLLAPLPPVIINAFGVSIYLGPLLGFGYWFCVQWIGLGQIVACYVIGLPLLILLRKRGIFV